MKPIHFLTATACFTLFISCGSGDKTKKQPKETSKPGDVSVIDDTIPKDIAKVETGKKENPKINWERDSLAPKHELFIRFYTTPLNYENKEDKALEESYKRNQQPRYLFHKDSILVKFIYTGIMDCHLYGNMFEKNGNFVLTYDCLKTYADMYMGEDATLIGTFVIKNSPRIKFNKIKVEQGSLR